MKNVFGLNNHLNQTVGSSGTRWTRVRIPTYHYWVDESNKLLYTLLNLSFSICKMGVTGRIACMKPTIQPSA